MGHRQNAFFRIALGITDPRHAVAAQLHGHAAHFSEQTGFVLDAVDGNGGAAEHLQRAVGAGQRQMGQFAVSDVSRHADLALQHTGVIAQRIATVAYPAGLAIGGHDAVLHIRHLPGAPEFTCQGQQVPVFRQYGIHVGFRHGIQALATAPPNLLVAGADVAYLAALGDIGVIKNVFHFFSQFAKARLAVDERLFGAIGFQGQPGQPGGRGNQVEVGGPGRAGRIAVNGKGGQHVAICSNYRC